jgi:hypothetical protein
MSPPLLLPVTPPLPLLLCPPPPLLPPLLPPPLPPPLLPPELPPLLEPDGHVVCGVTKQVPSLRSQQLELPTGGSEHVWHWMSVVQRPHGATPLLEPLPAPPPELLPLLPSPPELLPPLLEPELVELPELEPDGASVPLSVGSTRTFEPPQAHTRAMPHPTADASR